MSRWHLISNAFIIGFFALFWGVSSTLSALDPGKAITQYNVKTWNMKDGLPGNYVFAIRQTKDGYLWFGTQNGLIRFDGLNFESFTMENTTRLKDNNILSLYEDRDGTLWIGTHSGGLTRYKEGVFFTYPMEKYPALYRIRAIEEDRWGNLWIGSYGKGLTSLGDGQFTHYTTDHELPGMKVKTICKDGSRDLWVTTTGGTVKLLEPGIFIDHTPRAPLPTDNVKTTCLYEKDTESLWIGTGGAGLFRLKNGVLDQYGTGDGIPDQTITYLYRDRLKNFWVGTNGDGLTRMSNSILSKLPDGERLAGSFINTIYEDMEGSLWIGTVKEGLYQLRDGKFTTYTTREGLVDNYILCVHESRAGDLWIGTKGGLLRLKKGGTLTTEFTTGTGLLNNNVTSLCEDLSGHLWIGTWGGLHRFKDGKMTLSSKENGLSDNRIKSIRYDNRETIWIGTINGLNRFDNETGTFTVFTRKDGLSGNTVNFIFKDREGKLWIGTDAGLNLENNGAFTVHEPTIEAGNSSFQCVYQDDEGVLWFGTNNGLIRLKGEETTPYTIECGLIGNDVDSILEDKKGYLWLAGRNGISRVGKIDLEDFRRGKIKRIQPDSYNETDGMKSRWCTGPGCKTGDGRLWFPTIEGVAMIDPNNITPPPAPSPIIDKLIADGVTLETHAMVKEKKTLEVAPGKKRLEFHYKAISFINPKKMEFKIRLTGYDDDWVKMGTKRSTTYTGIPPGIYTFNVTSRHPGDNWNGEGTSFSFYLKPYFWQTTWFFVITALAIFLSVFGGYRFRVRQLRARARVLKTMVKNRTMELEAAHRELQKSKEIIEEKNRHTMAGIRYARKIQQTMLPMKEKMETHFKESFVLFQPKDIISGDFYWFDIVKGHYFVILADCTGHGVPGALLSMIGYMMLNEVMHGRRISDPAKILARLHQGFRYVLKQEVEDADTYDGMDIGLCRIDLKKRKLIYAGARRPLYYVKGPEFFEIKGDRKSIGGRQREVKHVFTNHKIDIPRKDRGGLMLYLTSDGYADQHNPGNKKYGSRRLRQFLRDIAHLSTAAQQKALMEALKNHRLDEEQRDDISIIGLRIP